MNCAQVQHHLDGWVRGEIDGVTSEVLSGHIASCAACASEAELARRIAGGLRALHAPAPVALVDRILETASTHAPARRIAWFTPLRALAAAVLVAVVILLSRDRDNLMTPMNPEVIAPPTAPLQAPPSAGVSPVPSSTDGTGHAFWSEEAVSAGEAGVPSEAPRPVARRIAPRTGPAASSLAFEASAPKPPATAISALAAPATAVSAPVAIATATPASALPATASLAPGGPTEAIRSAPPPTEFSAPSAAEAAPPPAVEPVPMYGRATLANSAGLLATGSYPAVGSAPGAARLASTSTVLESSGGSSTAGAVSLVHAEVSVPSRPTEERSSGTRIFTRAFSGNGNGGMTAFTQAHQLRSFALSTFRDTIAPTLIHPIPRR